MGKRKRKLTPAEKAEKKRRQREYMTIFVNGKQKRVKLPPIVDGIPVDEFNWFFRAESLAARFRNRYLRALRLLLERGKLDLPATPRDWVAVCSELAATDWVVYAKKPFAGAAQVMEYLGRYTHKVAISDYRILNIADGKVRFRYRDRASPEGFARTSR